MNGWPSIKHAIKNIKNCLAKVETKLTEENEDLPVLCYFFLPRDSEKFSTQKHLKNANFFDSGLSGLTSQRLIKISFYFWCLF